MRTGSTSSELYKQQVKEGRWFLHIHPASATSWSLKDITDVMDMEGVDVTAADQCMFGLKTWGMDGKSWEPAMKKTRFMSNSPEILSELTRQCDGRHRHQQLLLSRARPAARYPEGFVQGDLHRPHEGAAQQGVPREEDT